jgi:CDGSH-type Zn-finger protein
MNEPRAERQRLGVAHAREILITDDGPMLVSGPVQIELPDGSRVRSDRPVTALCVCRRSKRQPFCDTSHRRRVRTTPDPTTEFDPTIEEDHAQHDPTRSP